MNDDELREHLSRVLQQHAALSKQVLLLGEELAALAQRSPGPSIPDPEPVPGPVAPQSPRPDAAAASSDQTPPSGRRPPGQEWQDWPMSRRRGPQFSPPYPSGAPSLGAAPGPAARPTHQAVGGPGGAAQPQYPAPPGVVPGPPRGGPTPWAHPTQGAPGYGVGAPSPGLPMPRRGLDRQHPPHLPLPTPVWRRPDFTSKTLTVGGVIVTLVGVGLLLTLAWQSGFFGPIPQLITAIVLSSALVGAGVVVHRRDGANLGGPALVATGAVTAYATVFVATSVYEWVAPIVGLSIAAAIAVGGLLLAQRWGSQWLASAVALGGVLLMIFVGSSPSYIMSTLFVIVLTTISAGLALKRPWRVLRFMEVIPAALFLVVVVVIPSPDDALTRFLVALLFAVVALAVAVAQSLLHISTVRASCLALAIAVVPTWVGAEAAGATSGWITIALALVFAGLWLMRGEQHSALRAACLGLSAPTMLVGATALLDERTDIAYVIIGLAVAYWALAYRGDRVAALLGGLFTVGTLARWLGSIPDLFSAETAVESTVRSLLTIVVVVMAWWVVQLHADRWFARPSYNQGRFHTVLTTVGRLAVLALASVFVMQAGHLIGLAARDPDLGLQVGNAVVSVGWIALSAFALKRGLRSEGMTDVYWGLGLAAAAVAKLFLVDLGRLPGLVRVAAFLVVGLCLLAIGTQYAKALRAKQDAAPRPDMARQYPPPPTAPPR